MPDPNWKAYIETALIAWTDQQWIAMKHPYLRDFARTLGVSRQTLANWFKGLCEPWPGSAHRIEVERRIGEILKQPDSTPVQEA